MNLSRITVIAIIATAASATGASAAIFSPGPNPIPDGSGFKGDFPSPVCPPSGPCAIAGFIKNLKLVDAESTPAGFLLKYTPETIVTLFDDGSTLEGSLVPGTFMEITVGGGYNPFTNPTGTFPETFDSYSAQAVDGSGNIIQVSLLTTTASTGSVTITAVPGGFNVENVFTFFRQVTFNGVPISLDNPATLVNTPIVSDVVATPEPSSLLGLGALVAMGLVGCLKRK